MKIPVLDRRPSLLAHFCGDNYNLNVMNFKALRIKFINFTTIIKFIKIERHNYASE